MVVKFLQIWVSKRGKSQSEEEELFTTFVWKSVGNAAAHGTVV